VVEKLYKMVKLVSLSFLTEDFYLSEDSLGIDKILERFRDLLDCYLGLSLGVLRRADNSVSTKADSLNEAVPLINSEQAT
jgi:hypothetical protein